MKFTRPLLLLVALLVVLPAAARAQRELHWDRIEVEATLAADGTLEVVETQTMVFTGDWNGGERRFDIRPRQALTFLGISRGEGVTWRELTDDSSLDDVDDFAWTEPSQLRWRSRRVVDPPFSKTSIRYRLHYRLSGILQVQDGQYTLDHDFLFPDRDGVIGSFVLKLTLDPAWEPAPGFDGVYRAERVTPSKGFVLTVPLRFTGSGEPAVLDTSRPPEIVTALQLLFGVTVSAIAWCLIREWRRGRFAGLPEVEGASWLRQHVLSQPAEVIGAAWDDGVGSAEVVALIARLVAEGKLASDANSKFAMSLRLEADRSAFEGYERQLIDKLFFDNRVTTDTDTIKRHYRAQGFNPTEEIRAGVTARLDALLPPKKTSAFGFLVGILVLVSAGLLVTDSLRGFTPMPAALAVGIGGLIMMGIGAGFGARFRANLHLGIGAALIALVPALVAIAAVAVFLWSYAGLGFFTASSWLVTAMTAMALAVLFATIGSMRSRQGAEGVAFRQRLAAARAFFERELASEHPALEDAWFPWVLAFGLGKQMDDWSVAHASSHTGTRSSSGSSSSWTSTTSGGETTSDSGWTGFAGGRSGGGGASASWASAAGSLAAGVSPPSSGGSSSGGGSSSSSSSSGGSSGGGGGGGW